MEIQEVERVVRVIKNKLSQIRIICEESHLNEYAQSFDYRTFYYRGGLNTYIEQIYIYNSILSVIPKEYQEDVTIKFNSYSPFIQELEIKLNEEFEDIIVMYMAKLGVKETQLKDVWDNNVVVYKFLNDIEHAKSMTEIPVIDTKCTNSALYFMENIELPEILIKELTKLDNIK